MARSVSPGASISYFFKEIPNLLVCVLVCDLVCVLVCVLFFQKNKKFRMTNFLLFEKKKFKKTNFLLFEIKTSVQALFFRSTVGHIFPLDFVLI